MSVPRTLRYSCWVVNHASYHIFRLWNWKSAFIAKSTWPVQSAQNSPIHSRWQTRRSKHGSKTDELNGGKNNLFYILFIYLLHIYIIHARYFTRIYCTYSFGSKFPLFHYLEAQQFALQFYKILLYICTLHVHMYWCLVHGCAAARIPHWLTVVHFAVSRIYEDTKHFRQVCSCSCLHNTNF